ncbi:MAG: beta-propeller domain-containing protein [Deltaproteobacteria bacterium]|nr:beta-propeller domain-containing protein [Deltaproteobacteria bacterium]MDQ3295250.1 beta-propeller domain-containing protein [Myxococcota bacterium]
MPFRPDRIAIVASLVLAGCSDTGPPAPEPHLRTLPGCDAAISFVREAAIRRMNHRMDEAMASYRRGDFCPRYGYGEGYGVDDAVGTGGGGPPAPPSGPSRGTGTNNQVAGVDEADFVKNDGQYIYLAQNGVLRIIDAWPAEQTHEVSVTPLTGTPKKLFVNGDRVVVYVAIGAPDNNDSWRPSECTYGYDCDFTGDGSETEILVFDVSNRAAPVKVREIELSGSLIAGRRVGDAVHTVVTQASALFPDVTDHPQDDDVDICGYAKGALGSSQPPPAYWLLARDAFEAQRAKNLETILSTPIAPVWPSVADSQTPNADPHAASCASLYASSFDDGEAFTSIVSFDMSLPTPVTTSTVISRAGAVYASSDALYLAVAHNWSGDDLSTVHKFEISGLPNHTSYVASGAVPGRALNQFAMDEHEGVLRIATTSGHVPDPDVVSQLTVLDQHGANLVTIGSVSGIAPTEDIRSVRFDGDRAFIVTFKKTDPLFTFDLSNPFLPRKLGELKIPGFSTYMHMLDDNHLLTIGYDADDHGDFAYFDGVLLQIFDVTTPTLPRLAHKHVIGTRGSSSEALTNHLAFTWYPEVNLLALPMTVCEGGDDGTYGSAMTFSGLMVFDATVAAGFAEHGRVAHPLDPDATCSNWWTNASSVVKRSLFLDDFVYSVSDGHLIVRATGALGMPLVQLPLQ